MPSGKNHQTNGTCCIKHSLSMLYSQSADQIDIWREAINNLRTLHNDVWNGVRFFLTLNAIFLAGMSALARGLPSSKMLAYIIVALGVAGFLFSLVARNIFSNQRYNYIEMLLLKTLIEK